MNASLIKRTLSSAGKSALLVTAAAGLLNPGPADAAYVGTLTFIEPTGTAGPNDVIPVWLRFALDPTSDPLMLNMNGTAAQPFGVPVANYPPFFTTAWNVTPPEGLQSVTLDTLTGVYLNTFYTCSGTFTNGCTNGTPYDFAFNTTGPDTINFLPNYSSNDFTIMPGDSRDYLFGTFTPSSGPVSPGTYTFYTAGLTLNFNGEGTGHIPVLDGSGDPVPVLEPVLDEFGEPVLDDEGNPLMQQAVDGNGTPLFQETTVPLLVFGQYDLGSTFSQPSFERTISAVPLPGAIWMFGAGLGALGLFRRRPAPGR